MINRFMFAYPNKKSFYEKQKIAVHSFKVTWIGLDENLFWNSDIFSR